MAPIKEWFGLYNVMFRWLEEKYGENALEEYWKFIAEKCYDELAEELKLKGLEGIDNYFRETFEKDDGEYSSKLAGNVLECSVEKCPDYEFMKASSNPHFKPMQNYCLHHEKINSIIAEKAGYSFCMQDCSNDGKCKWAFEKK